ncbi:hypothetical protein DFH11DRAFT_1747577 [Phellopilus nigrolimitatus]|nr:hypothetical protein DFH11DRAFT_1747577 [Phellopilus nigrolimitatus]
MYNSVTEFLTITVDAPPLAYYAEAKSGSRMSTDPRHALLSLLPPAGVERWPFAPEEMEGSLKARRNSGHDAGDRALARGAVMMHVHKRKGSVRIAVECKFSRTARCTMRLHIRSSLCTLRAKTSMLSRTQFVASAIGESGDGGMSMRIRLSTVVANGSKGALVLYLQPSFTHTHTHPTLARQPSAPFLHTIPPGGLDRTHQAISGTRPPQLRLNIILSSRGNENRPQWFRGSHLCAKPGALETGHATQWTIYRQLCNKIEEDGTTSKWGYAFLRQYNQSYSTSVAFCSRHKEDGKAIQPGNGAALLYNCWRHDNECPKYMLQSYINLLNVRIPEHQNADLQQQETRQPEQELKKYPRKMTMPDRSLYIALTGEPEGPKRQWIAISHGEGGTSYTECVPGNPGTHNLGSAYAKRDEVKLFDGTKVPLHSAVKFDKTEIKDPNVSTDIRGLRFYEKSGDWFSKWLNTTNRILGLNVTMEVLEEAIEKAAAPESAQKFVLMKV